ncbi:putative nucleotidyltransferase substrate binding domain-containing protein [Mycobacterium sp. BMJ-28]
MPADTPSAHDITAALAVIDAAADEAELRAGIQRATQAVTAELAAQTRAPELAHGWSAVLRHGVAAAVRLTPGSGDRWNWFVSGSVARGEAAPGSDVETLIALDDAVADADKAVLLTLAADVHALLERCGIQGDGNGVLASRPRFCRRLSSWSEGIERWSADPREDRGVVMTGLLADAVGVGPGAGDVLRARTVAAAQRHYPVRQAMLEDATTLRAGFPSRLRIFSRHADTVDLKLAMVDPVVKIARWAGLSAGTVAVSTPERLDAAGEANILDAEDVSTLHECFVWLTRFRWRLRAGPWLQGGTVGDAVALADIAPHERAVLRGVHREVAGISRKLTFLASTSAFR